MGFNKDTFNPLLEKRFQKVYIADEIVKTILTTDATPQSVILKTTKEDSLLNFTALVSVIQTGGAAGTTGDSFCREYKGAIKNVATAVSFVDSDVWFQDIAIDDALAGIVIDIEANDSNDSLVFNFTGEVNKNLTCKIKLMFDEIDY